MTNRSVAFSQVRALKPQWMSVHEPHVTEVFNEE
jgi:hypothetical protein